MKTAKRTAFEGILVALVTPMTADEEVACKRLPPFIEHLIDAGVHGVVALGSTGEYYALSPSERAAVVRTTVEAAGGRIPVLVGTNAGSTRDVVRFSVEAQEMGADGVLLAAPYYSLPVADELYAHFRIVDEALEIPIMLYNYPGRTGVDLTPDLVERLSELKNVRYIKESTGDATRVTEIIRRCGKRIDVFCGCDTLALESLMMGAVGWVGGVANVLPAEHAKLFDLAVRKRDFAKARQLYYRMLPTLASFESGKYTQKVKAGCAIRGHRVGPPRRPLLPLSDAELREFKRMLQ